MRFTSQRQPHNSDSRCPTLTQTRLLSGMMRHRHRSLAPPEPRLHTHGRELCIMATEIPHCS